jgi:hypothetical protein
MAFWEGLQNFMVGQPQRIEQVNQFNPQQQSALQSLLGQGMQGMQNPYAGFEPIKQQAINQFNQQTIPSLAERFTSMGNNSMTSPLFASQMGQAGAGLSQNLAAMQSQYGMQNRNQMMSMLGMGLTPQNQNFQMDAQQGMLQQLLPALGQMGSHALGAFINPVGGGMSAILPALSKLLQGM